MVGCKKLLPHNHKALCSRKKPKSTNTGQLKPDEQHKDKRILAMFKGSEVQLQKAT